MIGRIDYSNETGLFDLGRASSLGERRMPCALTARIMVILIEEVYSLPSVGQVVCWFSKKVNAGCHTRVNSKMNLKANVGCNMQS